jgi:hypothetical protein
LIDKLLLTDFHVAENIVEEILRLITNKNHLNEYKKSKMFPRETNNHISRTVAIIYNSLICDASVSSKYICSFFKFQILRYYESKAKRYCSINKK